MPNSETWLYVQENHPWFFQVVVFCLGACMGSFLNVCIYRIPKGESIIRPPSHNARGQRLAWYDNLPLLSWFILRGRDRQSGERFSFRYVVVEFLTALLFLLCWTFLPWQAAICGMILSMLLVPAAFIDLDTMTLPDVFTMGGALLGVLVSCLLPGLHVNGGEMGALRDTLASCALSFAGLFVGSGLVLWLLVLGEWLMGKPAMGEGDIFLAGCIGAFLGWQGAFFSVFGGSVVALAFLLPLMLAQRLFGLQIMAVKREESHDSVAETEEASETSSAEAIGIGASVPFGPWMALAAMLYLLAGRSFVEAYVERLREVLFPF